MGYYDVSNPRRDFLYGEISRLSCISDMSKYILDIRDSKYMLCIAAEPENKFLAKFYLYSKIEISYNNETRYSPDEKLGRVFEFLEELPEELQEFALKWIEYF